MPAAKTLTKRHLKTSALTRVLALVDGSTVVGLRAKRSLQLDAENHFPVPYVNTVARNIQSWEALYNSHHHGVFNAREVTDSLKPPIEDALVTELNLLLPKTFSKQIGAAVPKADRHQFVLHMVHYPCRRDGEKNRFWADTFAQMTEDEKKWMEPGSLDFEFFVPASVFRDLSKKKGRVSAEYRERINEWKKHAGKRPDLVRTAMLSAFDDSDLLGSRTYRWGPEDKWILDKVGAL